MSDACPCGSGKSYRDCCEPLHRGAPAESAEALMRSRYSAFVLKLAGYLLSTWHPSTRPAHLTLNDDATEWLQLRIIDREEGGSADTRGMVEFVADFRGGQLHERSRFAREEGRWCYVDGEILPPLPAPKAGRNDPCPCGSGKKYKKCCGGGG